MAAHPCNISFAFLFSSEEQSRLAARKYARVIQKLGFQVHSEFYIGRGIFC